MASNTHVYVVAFMCSNFMLEGSDMCNRICTIPTMYMFTMKLGGIAITLYKEHVCSLKITVKQTRYTYLRCIKSPDTTKPNVSFGGIQIAYASLWHSASLHAKNVEFLKI